MLRVLAQYYQTYIGVTHALRDYSSDGEEQFPDSHGTA